VCGTEPLDLARLPRALSELLAKARVGGARGGDDAAAGSPAELTASTLPG
jgi:hypothetical protein